MPRSGPGPVIFSPRAKRAPDVGKLSPAIMFKIVDLPEPDGPSTETNSPRSMRREVGAMTVFSP